MASIRHVDIAVTSVPVSQTFYLNLLGILGWSKYKDVRGERGETIVYLAGRTGPAGGALGLRQKQVDSRVPFDRYAVGLHHVAFNAATREEVDDCSRWLARSGARTEGAPTDYYNGEYYAVFAYDPDGIKIEIVYAT